MARPLRLEFPGSLWHVTARGNARADIVRDDADRRRLLDLLGAAADRFAWIVHQYALMTNHYHLVLELTATTLSAGMQWLNAKYAQAFNRRYGRVGHLFQGRFHARLIEKDTYLLEVLRYVALNPVRSGIVSRAEDYAWSGHRALAGLCEAPQWLAVHRVLACFAPRLETARVLYADFVDEGLGRERKPWHDVVGQIYLGTDEWIERVRDLIASKPRSDEHPSPQTELSTMRMADVIAAVARGFSINENLIRFGRGGRPRMLAAWIGCHRARLDLRAIAASLRIRSTGRISMMISACEEQLRTDTELQAVADRCTDFLQRV